MANTQTKSEATLLKKVWDIANVLAAAGVGYLKMEDKKEELGCGSSLPEGCKWKGLADLNGSDLVEKY